LPKQNAEHEQQKSDEEGTILNAVQLGPHIGAQSTITHVEHSTVMVSTPTI